MTDGSSGHPGPPGPHTDISKDTAMQSDPEFSVPSGAFSLSAQDQAAVDRILENGFDESAMSDPRVERVPHIAKLLNLLNIPEQSLGRDEALIDATLARVARERVRPISLDTENGLELSADDQEALEAYVGAGYDASGVPTHLQTRAERVAGVLGLLEVSGIESGSREALVRQTLERVQRGIDADQDRMQLELHRPGRRFRAADLVSVAALLLIGTAVIGPMVGSVRALGQRTACMGGFEEAAVAFTQYANDSRDSLPMAYASIAGTPWWNVGKPNESNSANFYTLSRTGYTKLERQACPTNAAAQNCSDRDGEMDWRCMEEVSYSLQNLYASERPRWNESNVSLVVLVDRSPVVPLAKNKLRIRPYDNSPNHRDWSGRARGQNALFNDGSAVWLKSPVLSTGDNIWMPRSFEDALAKAEECIRTGTTDPMFKGTESPAARDDSFVGP